MVALVVATGAAGTIALAGCASAPERLESDLLLDDARRKASSVEVAELEIHGDGTDRFVHCAPPGELGQSWVPPLPPWSPARPTEAAAAPLDVGLTLVRRNERGPARTERLLAATRFDFKRCYDASRFAHPAQEGRAAIVLRVGGDGRVAAVESYGACVLSHEALRCMKESATSLRFEPPDEGQDTVVIPAVYGRPTGPPRSPTANDAYANAAYIAIEAARRELHTCEAGARRAGRAPVASATFNLDITRDGRVARVRVDPFRGDRELLACAAHVLEQTPFENPPAGAGSVLARIAFNPRPGVR